MSPGGVGFDINCGVRLLRTNLTEKDVAPVKEKLAQSLFDHIPVGVGSKVEFNNFNMDRRLSSPNIVKTMYTNAMSKLLNTVKGIIPMGARDLDEALEMGMDWSLREGYVWAEDKVEHSCCMLTLC